MKPNAISAHNDDPMTLCSDCLARLKPKRITKTIHVKERM